MILKAAALAIITAGVLSLCFGFSIMGGLKMPVAPQQTVRTTITQEVAPPMPPVVGTPRQGHGAAKAGHPGRNLARVARHIRHPLR